VLAAIFLLAWIWRVLYLGRLSRTVLGGDLTEDSRTYWAWSKLLIEHGARVDGKDEDGRSLAQNARQLGRTEIAELLEKSDSQSVSHR